MPMGEAITTERLIVEIERTRQRLERAGEASSLREGTWLFIRALDHRMNSATVVASIPSSFEGLPPSEAFARWLDEGAPGLAAAAAECDWEGHFEVVRSGAPPSLRVLSSEEFVSLVDDLLTKSRSFYGKHIEAPAAIRAGFLDAEFGGRLGTWQFYAVHVDDLDARLDYFDHMGNDHCLLWTDGTSTRVLFTNGSD